MQLTPRITFRGVQRSDEFEADILRRIQKLETYFRPIMGCRVLIELRERRHEAGNRYHVRIDLTVPGDELVITREATLRAAARKTELQKVTKQHETSAWRKYALVAVREAFDAARRRLQDYARRHRGAVKSHTPLPRGRVVRLFPRGAYGFIEAPDGHEVFFQKSAVLGSGFSRLAVGTEVTFVEEAGQKGPQASTVRVRRTA